MRDTSTNPPTDPGSVRALLDGLVTARWPGAAVLEIADLPADASSRRYLRCTLDGTAAEVCPPTSVVVMLLEDAAVAMSSEELGVFANGGPTELPFLNLQRFLAAITDSVPEVYAVSGDQRTLVLEDLGDVSLWAAAKDPGADTEALFARALALLADIQAAAAPDRSCYAYSQCFDERLFGWEFDHFIEHGLASPPAEQLQACRLELAGLAATLAHKPRVFCHRDYHAWNIHVADGRLRLFDFQDALLGPAFYDAASLLTDRSSSEIISPAMERRLLESFAQRTGVRDMAEAWDSYCLCAFQRALKVIGRFNFLAENKGKPAYLQLLPATVATARRFAAEIDGLDATAGLLARHVKSGRTDELRSHDN